MPTKTSGFFLQSRAAMHVITPLSHAPYGIAHHAREELDERAAWRRVAIFGEALGRVSAVSLIQSNFGDPGNLEAVALAGDQLAAFWHGASWSEPLAFASGVSGTPALIQGSQGHRGHFELVAPLARGGLGYWYRDNDTAELSWHGPIVFGEQAGPFQAVALLQSKGEGIEVIARAGDRLVAFRGSSGAGASFQGPVEVVSGVAGRPALGELDLLAPLAAVGIAHWRRDNDGAATPWRGPDVLATDLGRCDEVSLLRGADGRLEIVALAGGRMVHLRREGAAWARHTAFSLLPAPEPPEQPEIVQSEPPSPAAPPSHSAPPSLSAPLSTGQHAAGFRRISEIGLSEDALYPDARPYEGIIYQCPQKAQGILYYPSTTGGEDAPLASGGPFPIIAFAHARRLRGSTALPGAPEDTSQDYRQLTGVMAHLARRGFVVIAPDLSWLTPDEGPLRRAAALRDAIIHLRAGSKGPLLADFDRVGLIGYGLGGLAAVSLAADRACPFHVRALGLLAPTSEEPMAELPRGLAVLVLRGETDIGLSGAGNGPLTIYDRAGPPRYLVTIPGANHFGFTTSIALDEPFDGAPSLARRDQQRIARAYLAAFFDHYLGGVEDRAGWLRGEAAIDELSGLAIAVRAEPQ